jgi:outer membrane protein OmpA-like peptidoglycan-associated protein
MMNNITKLAVIGVMIAPAAFADGFQRVVPNTHGNISRNTFNNCVVSTFTSPNDECTGQLGKPDIYNLSKEWRNVYFDFNRSTLNVKEKAKLDQLSQVILDSKEVQNVDLTGYADVVGNASYNKRLSMKRAQTVKSYLAKKGLKTRKVKIEGLGESTPVTNCGYADGTKATAEQIACLAEDRRVEIKLNFIKK